MSDDIPASWARVLHAAQRGDLVQLHAGIDWALSEAPIPAQAASMVVAPNLISLMSPALDRGIARIRQCEASWREAAEVLAPVTLRLAAVTSVRSAASAEADAVLQLARIVDLPAWATPSQRAFFDPLRERAELLRDVWFVQTPDGDLPVVLTPRHDRVVLPLACDAYLMDEPW